MDKFTRTGNDGGFAKVYKHAEELLKKQRKYLDFKNKKICEDIIKNGEKFWGHVEAKSRSEYEKMVSQFVKESSKALDNVEAHIQSEIRKAA